MNGGLPTLVLDELLFEDPNERTCIINLNELGYRKIGELWEPMRIRPLEGEPYVAKITTSCIPNMGGEATILKEMIDGREIYRIYRCHTIEP